MGLFSVLIDAMLILFKENGYNFSYCNNKKTAKTDEAYTKFYADEAPASFKFNDFKQWLGQTVEEGQNTATTLKRAWVLFIQTIKTKPNVFLSKLVVDKNKETSHQKNMTLSPYANRACRIGPNFTANWFPCFIHYYIFTLSLTLNYEMA